MLVPVPVLYKAVWNVGGHRRSLEVVPETLAVAYARHAWSSGSYGALFVFDRLHQAIAYLQETTLAGPGYEIWEVEADQVFPARLCVNPSFVDVPAVQAFWGGELARTAQLQTAAGTYGANRCKLLNRAWKGSG